MAFIDSDQISLSVESERITRRKHESDVSATFQIAEKLLAKVRKPDRVVLAAATNLSQRILGLSESEVMDLMKRVRKTLFAETYASFLGSSRNCIVVAHEASHAALACSYAEWEDRTLILVNEGSGSFSRNSLFMWNDGRLSLLETDCLPWYGSGFGWTF